VVPRGNKARLTLAVLAVKAGFEVFVQQQIRALGMCAYVPQYLVNLRKKGMTARALFPGYIFVWVKDQWRELRTLLHVYDFLRAGDDVIKVPHKVVDGLRKREGPTGYVRINNSFFVGQQVKVKRGPDLAGQYLGLDAKHKLRVLFRLLGAEMEVSYYEKDLVAAV